MREAKPVLCLVTVLALAFAAAGDADARPRPAGRRTSSFQANKTFGLGIMIGAPTGLSGKYYLGSDTAIDFGIGAIYGYRGRDGLHLHMDYLWHPLSLVSAEPFELPLYFGIGGRFYSVDYDRDDRVYDDVQALGVRVPVGVAFDFNNIPMDIFIELALVFDFIFDDYYDDDFDVDFNPAVGIRYYFN
jgi:hypothetical protein